MNLVQLSRLFIGSGQPAHHADRRQVVSCLHGLLLHRKQPLSQEGYLATDRKGQREGEGEGNHVPAHLFIWRQSLCLLSELPQTLIVATLEELSDLDQSTHQAQTPLDQRHLGLGEQKRWLPAQDLLHARNDPLHLGGHTGMQRFGADTDGVEEAKSGIKGEARIRTQDGIWQGEHPGVDGSGFPTEPEVRSRLFYQGGGIRIVRRGKRVGNGLSPLALRLIPAGCPEVQERHQFWLARVQTSAQRLTKEIMIPVPLPLLIQGHHKEVGSLHLLQRLLAYLLRRLCRDRLA